MELYYSDKYFVLLRDDNEDSLWINRENGAFSTKAGRESVERNPTLFLIGRVYGFIGILKLSSVAEPRLVFIRSQEEVCKIKDDQIYKITSVVSVPLETECEVEVENCSKSLPEGVHPSAGITALPSAISHGSPGTTEVGAPMSVWNKAKIPSCPNSKKYGGRVDRTERRLVDEFYKMFAEADSFYYCNEYNIFNTLQRDTERSEPSAEESNKVAGSDATKTETTQPEKNHGSKISTPLWKRADERFFWNNYMLSELIESENVELRSWMVAIMQGSIQHEVCQLDPSSARVTQNDSEAPSNLELVLISRRSRYRAGTRYLRRGVDENGHVANYVETEQIMVFRGHMISFVQTRGSVPVFWSQPGYKYRPPIRLDKSVEEGYYAYEKHMDEQLKLYGDVALVSLVEKNGKEKVLEDAYRKCVLSHNADKVSYITFDFHDKCRGLKFENVTLLTEKITDIIKNMAYCWVDSYGVVMKQNGTFRVNCVDCLDRTNVVQSFIAREVLSHQLSKVGLLMPEIGLSDSIRTKFLTMWANNGDIISKQYAGTNALKGDFTRTGQRRFAGVMKDGMNSANRYLNNRLKDGTRQACIDLILGVRSSVTEEELTLGKEAVEEKETTTELVMQMIDDVRHCVVPPHSIVVGSWGLVNAKTNEAGAVDVDTVLVLTESDCFIATYDCSLDTIANTTGINLSGITSIEIMNEPVAYQNVGSVWGIFQGSATNNSQAHVPSLKLHFNADDNTKDYFYFRSSNLRFFNNCLTPIAHPDEMMEALKMLAETIKTSVYAYGNHVIPITQGVSQGKSSQKGIPAINSWIPKWSSATPQQSTQETNAEPFTKKFSPASMQRFAPSFLKKRRNNPQACEDEDAGAKVAAGHPDNSVPQSLAIPTSLHTLNQQDPNNFTTGAHLQARTPMEVSSTVQPPVPQDLYLSACGIVSLHLSSVASLHTGFVSEYNKASPGLSPVTPIMDVASQDVTPTSTDTNPSLRLNIPHDALQRHRYSLPTNSLTITSSPSTQSGRSTTPEIRITEEPSQTLQPNLLTGSVASVSNQKRMSRSSEDVNKVSAMGAGVKMFNNSFINKVPLSFKNKLVPSLPQESRSTSDQDIFSTLVSMKGSHSESAIKDGNPVQKRDVVFAPLGKLAKGMQNIGVNYLDPRKLRDSLRQPRQDIAPVEDPDLVEKMIASKSRFIDI